MEEYKEPCNDPQMGFSSPTSQSDNLTPQSARSANTDDPFLDHAKHSANLTRSHMPLPQRIPRETTFRSYCQSQADPVGTPLNPFQFQRLPRDETLDTFATSHDYCEENSNPQLFREPDLQSFNSPQASAGGTPLTPFQRLPREVTYNAFNSSHPSDKEKYQPQLPREATFQSFNTARTGASDHDYANASSHLHTAFQGLAPPTPNNDNTQKNSGETTVRGTVRTSSTITTFDHVIDAAGGLSSNLHDATPRRPAPANVPYTPSNYNNTQPNLKRLAGGHNPRTKSSSYSLNKEVRLREAAKQQDTLLRQERNRDSSRRVSNGLSYHDVPRLRPSPIALKVAAQLIRDSPAGKLPVGPQAVLHSKSFWTGIIMVESGLMSTTAVISAIVHDRNDFINGAGAGANPKIFWLVISIILLIFGFIISGLAYIRKMGYHGNTEKLFGLDEVGLVNRLLRRERRRGQEPELGSLPGSVQSFGTLYSTPRQRQGMYATQNGVGRFTQASINTFNTEWQELYMTPEQLREHFSQKNLQTPNKPEKPDPDSVVSLTTALKEANAASEASVQTHKPAVAHTKSAVNPFCRFPEPPTPQFPPQNMFYQMSTLSGCSIHDNERGRVEVDMWSPLENLQRDINSERVRNMPIQQRLSYIAERRIESEERSRKIRESLEQPSVTRSRNGTLSRRNSEGTTIRPAIIPEDTRGRCEYLSADDLVLRPERGSFYDEDGVEMTDMGASTGKDTLTAEAKSEFQKRRASGGSVEKMKKMIASVNDHFTELNGRNIGSAVKEKIVRLREESKRGEGRK